jgi:hypothetical protein
VLFAVGVIAERSAADDHAEPIAAASTESGEAAHADEEGATAEERGETAHADEDAEVAGKTAGSVEAHSESEQLLGLDVESTPVIVLAVLAGLALSAAAASDLRHRRAFLVTVAVIALGWAALDVRELLHQIDESREGIAALAAVVAVVHLLAAAVAGLGASSAPAASA